MPTFDLGFLHSTRPSQVFHSDWGLPSRSWLAASVMGCDLFRHKTISRIGQSELKSSNFWRNPDSRVSYKILPRFPIHIRCVYFYFQLKLTVRRQNQLDGVTPKSWQQVGLTAMLSSTPAINLVLSDTFGKIIPKRVYQKPLSEGT